MAPWTALTLLLCTALIGQEQQISETLQEVQIPVIGNKQCSCNYIPVSSVKITDNMICAGQENKGACQSNLQQDVVGARTYVREEGPIQNRQG
ncbi:hypothetical protein PAMP_010333 [Pampus punctatissimus]